MQDKKLYFADFDEMLRLYGWLSKAYLRRLLNNRRTNGLDECTRRLGRKILICVEDFECWVNRQKETAGA